MAKTNVISINYNTSVFTPCGWRNVEVTGVAEKISEKRCKVLNVDFIDNKKPVGYASRTGAKRQQYNALGISFREIDKIKNINTLNIRKLKITRAGYIYINDIKISNQKLTPFYNGNDVLTKKEQEIAQKWINRNYSMINS